MKKTVLSYLLILFVTYADANDFVDSINTGSKTVNDALLLSEDPTTGFVVDTALVSASIAVWGFTQWNWGTESFHFHDEGWFEEESKTGGSDKTGHLYMTYLLSRVMASRMQDRGLSLRFGALSQDSPL